MQYKEDLILLVLKQTFDSGALIQTIWQQHNVNTTPAESAQVVESPVRDTLNSPSQNSQTEACISCLWGRYQEI